MKALSLIFCTVTLFMSGCDHIFHHAHDQEEEHSKIRITAYNEDFEVFAEADPLVAGDSSNVLSHFSHLPSFKALDSGSVTLRLIAGGKVVSQTLEAPTRKGIFSFDIVPAASGKARIEFEIYTRAGKSLLEVSDITVYSDAADAAEAALMQEPSKTNTVVFTKEQSWKIDFATDYPIAEAFGPMIRTTARVMSAQGEEMVVAAKTSGMLVFNGGNVLEGIAVNAGQALFTVTGSGMADNNSVVRYYEAQNNYNKAKSNYERIRELAKDKIVSEKELIIAETEYKNAKILYETLSANFSSSGQTGVSPMSGFIKQLFVSNGQFVEAGQSILSITKNRTLMLRADVQQKYAPILALVTDATIRTMHNNHTYTLKELNGKILSYGKASNEDDFLLPVTLQIDNIRGFTSGGFVELCLKSTTGENVLTIPLSALIEEQGNYFVFVQIHPELFEKRLVKIGDSDGINVEMLGGLTRNDRIVTRGAILVKLAQSSAALDPHAGHVH
jgi:membrane fusion protein, heavy metal efflux system